MHCLMQRDVFLILIYKFNILLNVDSECSIKLICTFNYTKNWNSWYYDFPMKWEGIMFSCSSSNFSIWVKFFTDLDELPWVHYESVDVCLSVRLSPDKTNFNSKRYKSIFEIYTYWIKQDVDEKVMTRKFKISNLKKNIG